MRRPCAPLKRRSSMVVLREQHRPPWRGSNSQKQSRLPQDLSVHSMGDVCCSSLCPFRRRGFAPPSRRRGYVIGRVVFEVARACATSAFPLIVPCTGIIVATDIHHPKGTDDRVAALPTAMGLCRLRHRCMHEVAKGGSKGSASDSCRVGDRFTCNGTFIDLSRPMYHRAATPIHWFLVSRPNDKTRCLWIYSSLEAASREIFRIHLLSLPDDGLIRYFSHGAWQQRRRADGHNAFSIKLLG